MASTGDDYTHGKAEFTGRVTDVPGAAWPLECGRYRLVASLACPWASRAVLVRHLLGLEDVLSLGVVDPIQDERSWRFTLDPGGRDPVLGIAYLHEAYDATGVDYANGVSVPAIVDTQTGKLVSNDFHQITLDLETEWTRYHRDDAPDLYPKPLRDEIHEVAARVYRGLNDAVYAAGFAGSQEAYEKAYSRIFDCLDWMSSRLRGQRYLVGETITEADVRAFTTLVRFDAVYHNHFKCNRNKIAEDPVLQGYLLDLYQTAGFADTVSFAHIKRHYYQVHTDLNPTRIIPAGPETDWTAPHGRERLGGSPFGDATAPERDDTLVTYRDTPPGS
ncbi:MAG: glutathione S-transferase C-terminal domain-containing protein [Actinomycetota bacterium]|nr:glutathione S-transferase C-terminal domain-containing protein [Actinomycetota bacterium]